MGQKSRLVVGKPLSFELAFPNFLRDKSASVCLQEILAPHLRQYSLNKLGSVSISLKLETQKLLLFNYSLLE